MIDRQGERWWVFDADGTRETVRERELPPDGDRPAPRRRQAATAPGYTGRKRAERVQNRMVLQQAHTQEMLGSFPMPGNGHRGAMLDWVSTRVAAYATAHALATARCLVRTDGEHGVATQVVRLARAGLGWLVRCAAYHLLKEPAVQAALQAGTTVRWTHPDSGVVRDVFDVPTVRWTSADGDGVDTRLLVTRHAVAPPHAHRIGHRHQDVVYELFATSAPPDALHAVDVVTLFLHRGQFETALAQEERELPTAHWVSNAPHGQRLWHLLAQWVWNLRIGQGRAANPETLPLRTTDFTPTIELVPVVAVAATDLPKTPAPTTPTAALPTADARPSTTRPHEPDATRPAPGASSAPECPDAPHAAPEGRPDPAVSAREAAPQETPTSPDACADAASPPTSDARPVSFWRDEHGTMHCPAGLPMHRVALAKGLDHGLEWHSQSRTQCAGCDRKRACRGALDQPTKGRRIQVRPEAQTLEVQWHGGQVRAVEVPLDRLRRSAAAARPPSVPGATPAPPLVPSRAGGGTAPTSGPPPTTEVTWLDVEACRARTTLRAALRQLRVAGHLLPLRAPLAPPPTRVQTRAHCAHRRRPHDEHLRRNLAPEDTACVLRFHGLPPSLAEALGIRQIE